ncbi:putative ferric-chelate reductase 1 homolog isoform X1 [Teleopsis dalmanni]|uniref:putative ferric-chelate reductase 1 homolog isoform X1 n=1 Tax=Teleopsis dalmanni TaxID=139649 RepID=UPI0018CE18AB|nr:putative ferric-chelate reductase 1 homolog isoform X1 [Teleopsis dalmanni]
MFRYNSKNFLLHLLVVLNTLSWTPIMSLPQGAPETVCDTMLPFHGGGFLPQSTVPPFNIVPSTSVIGQGQTLRVDIQGGPFGINFGGFMIQARNRNPPYQIIGQFNPTLDGRAKLMNCENSVNNSATHSNARPKTDVSLEWLTPVDFLGQVIFNATVAQQYDTFWVGIPSNPVQVVKRDVAPSYSPPGTREPYNPTRVPYVPLNEPTTTTQKPDDPFYVGCGRSKTCFGFPDNCVKDKSCKAVASTIVRGDIYEFELKSFENNAAYVALGLSDDNKMGDDLVIECVPQNGQISAYSSYTAGGPNYAATRAGVPQNTHRLLDYSLIDGVIYCKVQREPVTIVKDKMFDLINSKYHLLVAAGRSLKESGVGYHDIGRLPSAQPINLAVVQDLSGSSVLLLRLHGAFMIAAWIGTTSLGILLARYFKQTWVGSQTCGKDQWFVWHRVCMVTTWTLTMVAFVLIFVELGAWSAERNPHAILGVITTFLCFIQPIGAIFRPAPNSKNRPFFNWAHWLGGNLAHILAIVTIFFAVGLTKAELPQWMDWILVGFIVFHVIVHLIYSVFLCMQIAGCSSDRQQTQRVNTFQMGEMGHHAMRNGMKLERNMDAPYARFRKGLLGVYIVVLALFVVALILVVVLAPIEETLKSSL